MSSSRSYRKRVWRVPKDRGAPTYAAALVLKALRKHGWPADVALVPSNWGEGFQILHTETGRDAAPDFWQAAAIAARVIARSYRLDLDVSDDGLVMFNRVYVVTTGGFFKEVNQ